MIGRTRGRSRLGTGSEEGAASLQRVPDTDDESGDSFTPVRAPR